MNDVFMVVGVYKNKTGGWKTRIAVDGELKYLGTYADFDEAVLIRYSAEQCLGWNGIETTARYYLKQRGLIQ